jgi:hypothetical protein
LTLSGLAAALREAFCQGQHFRLLLPRGPWCEFLIPRLVDRDSPACLKRIPQLDAIALDI